MATGTYPGMMNGGWESITPLTGGIRLTGVFTPVRNPIDRTGEGACATRHAIRQHARSCSPWMGTPEILFARPVDNSRLVRVTDPLRVQEMRQFAIATMVLFLFVMFYAWQHYSAIEFGYRNEALKMQRTMLQENNRELRLNEASLRAPERIDILARQMGLVDPQAGQLQRLDEATDAQSPVLARAQDLAAAATVR